MSIFHAMRDFSRKTKVVRLADPEDIIREVHTWSDEDLQRPIMDRGRPIHTKLEIKPGAITMDFNIRALTMRQRELCDAVLDASTPPPTFIEEPSDRPGVPPRRVPTGYDEENPEFVIAQRTLSTKQAALVTLFGVDKLEEDTPGGDDETKLLTLMDTMPTRMIRFLAAEIWNITYANGDPIDFFTKEDSENSQNSESSLKPNKRGNPRK